MQNEHEHWTHHRCDTYYIYSRTRARTRTQIVARRTPSGPVYPLERYFVWNAVVSIDRWVFILVSSDPLL